MGYALVGTVDGVRWVYPLGVGTHRIGRLSTQADIVFHTDTVSRLHACIIVDAERVAIVDMESHNGTYVNGEPVKALRQLVDGDVIRLGEIELWLRRDDGDGARPPEASQATPSGDDLWPRADSARSVPRFRPDAHLDSARLFWSKLEMRPEEGHETTEFLAALVDLAGFLVRDESDEDVCSKCLERVAGLFKFRLACLLELNDVGEAEVRCHYPSHLAPELEVSRRMVDAVVREGQALLVRDVAAEAPLWESAYRRGIRSAIVAPLMQNATVLGVLYLDHEDSVGGFEKRHLRRLQLLANLVAAKMARTRTRKDIQIAAQIQRDLLGTPRAPAGYEVAVRLEPSELVGGDLYDSLVLPDGRHLYALGDIVGHGIGAALLMANVLATLRALARMATSPLTLAQDLQEVLSEQLAPHGFVTLFLCMLDPRTHRLEYVNAGHEPPALLVPGAPLVALESTGPPLGMRIPVPLRDGVLTIAPGAALCCWSDGIPESIKVGSRPPQDFTRECLLEQLKVLRDEHAPTIVTRVFEAVDAFVGTRQAQDDRTMLVLRRQPGEPM